MWTRFDSHSRTPNSKNENPLGNNPHSGVGIHFLAFSHICENVFDLVTTYFLYHVPISVISPKLRSWQYITCIHPNHHSLIIDGHGSHMTWKGIEQTHKFRLDMIIFPLHALHALQHLNVYYFKPLKQH